MDIHGDLNFKEVGQLIAAALAPESPAQFPDVAADFAPGSIRQGRLAFFNSRVWIAVELVQDGSPASTEVATWIPLTNEINAYVHTQAVAATSWSVTHNLDSGTPAVQIYDENNLMVIPDEIEPTGNNTLTITFNAAVTGRAIVLAGDFEGVSRGDNPQAQAFEHTQSVAADTWVIAHGLGYYPIVRVFIPTTGSPVGDQEILPASIVHNSVMQVTITFSGNQTGRARLV